MLAVIYYPTVRLWKIIVNLIHEIEKYYRSGGNTQSKFLRKAKEKSGSECEPQLLIPVKCKMRDCWPRLDQLVQVQLVTLTWAELHPFGAGWATRVVGSLLAGNVLLCWETVLWRCLPSPLAWLTCLKMFLLQKGLQPVHLEFQKQWLSGMRACLLCSNFFFPMCNCFAYLCEAEFESPGILWLWLDLSCIICSLLSVLSQMYHSNLCNNYIQFLLITFNQRCEVSCSKLCGRPVG